jgi:RsiW-degrading membrane proteinase PrsW (M82 family)
MRERTAAVSSPERIPQEVPLWFALVMLTAALGGGWVAAAVALLPGLTDSDVVLALLFLAVPFYEEALKPLGVYFVFLCWPRITLSRLQVASLAAAGGLGFALVESWVFVDAHPEEGSDFVLFRFTVPVVMHVFASFILGLGLTPAILRWFSRRGRLPRETRTAYLTAAGLHMFYNLTIIFLTAVGVLGYVEEAGA